MAEIRYGQSQAAGVGSGRPRQIIVTVPDKVEARRRAIRKRAFRVVHIQHGETGSSV